MKILVKIVAKSQYVAPRSNNLIPASPTSDGEMSVYALTTLMQNFEQFGASASIVPSLSSASQSPIIKQESSTSTSAQFYQQQQLRVNTQFNNDISHTLPKPKQEGGFVELGKLQIHQGSINTDAYNVLVKVIPDRDYSIFTPLLLSKTMGVVPLVFTVTQQPCEYLVHLPPLNTTHITLNISACKHDEDDYFCFSEYSNNLTLYSASPYAQDDGTSTFASANHESQQQLQQQSSHNMSQAGNSHHTSHHPP